ncbi:TetR/AcrR family transcriptional regulator [Paraburkholderia caribensis]|uniref:TetR/AcrR family transcriptional regulator n=1 Tax=Paraburkholderia caribensis TaxID=75105 RepID=UPI001CAC143A|nr:TetR/AcrR family transcriptional regulator [Paraburkholderia caribensis]CAG9243787.1 Regulatory protein, tetR family [Paraburkholderia caribensis]
MDSAKRAFSTHGYSQANVRDIAAEAGITAALIVRYFGSKEKLFEEAVAEAFDFDQTFEGTPRAELGNAITAHLFSEPKEADLLAMMLLAASDPTMNHRIRRLVHARMFRPMVKLIGGTDAERRATLILSMVTGLWVYRFMLPLKTISDRVDADTRRQISVLIQQIIDGDD